MSNTLSATISSNGRVQIPASVRKQLNLKDGDLVLFRLQEGGVFIESPIQAWQHLQEVLKPYRRKAGEESHTDEFLRERREEAIREGY